MSAIDFNLIGRNRELNQIRACLWAKRNVLLEGPVGVGKTRLALAVTRELGIPVFRVDGDSRYSEQKLSGWFDPPTVLQKGYHRDAFIPGPLVEAMQKGGILFINELNRLPEGVQNVLLPAIDERMIVVPRLGEVQAAEGFLVIATQNPKEFVATSHLSEAILDRFELIVLDYQSEEEEIGIVSQSVPLEFLSRAAVSLIRLTRSHVRVRRGASVRAALSVAKITQSLLKQSVDPADPATFREAFLSAALMALPTRIEIERDIETGNSPRHEFETLIESWVHQVLENTPEDPLKKKTEEKTRH